MKRDSLRYNEALEDLEQSIELNDNRSLFRSQSLLDEDIAVRRSNLAEIYQEAGLPTQALAEAGKAIQNDYTNFAAHDFLARVYRERFDETNINQRNDTALANEFFLRNILAPVGAGIASQKISNQEYSSLFNEEGFSGTIAASYDSRERYNTSGFFAYQGANYEVALELEHEDWNDFYVNDDFESTTTQVHFRFEPTAQDRFYSLLIWNESEQGDLRALPDPDSVDSALQNYTVINGRTQYTPSASSSADVNPSYGRNTQLRVEEEQRPLFFNTYARQWNENHTSLFLYGWINTEQTIEDALFDISSSSSFTSPATQKIYRASFDIEQDFDLHTFEWQHIWKGEKNQLIFGTRFQTGEIEDDSDMLAAVNSLIPIFTPTAIDSDGSSSFSEDFERIAVYGQLSHELNDTFTIIAGLKYDAIEYPDGLGSIPRAESNEDESQLSPQAGFIWQLDPNWLLRGAYARSMSGYQIEDQLRLEPSNIAGLTTAYTSIAPSQIIPNLAGGTIDAISLALTGKLLERTYLSVDAGFGTFSGDRTLGQFSESLPPFAVPNTPGQLSVEEIDQSIDYEEFSFATRFDQLLNTTTSIGASFSWQYAEIDEDLRNDLNITSTSPYLDDTNAHLYIGSVYARYQNPNGWFATTDLQYWYQENNSIEP
ncbi:MAG: TonB-dependent receptor, partial [Coraliomargarita sp.]|nr:TonB-dependent receptor [Coraliomargarita sp.]